MKCHTYHGPEDSHNTIAMYCSLSLLSLLLVLYLYFYFYYSIAYSNIKRNPFSHSVHLHSLIPNIHFCCIAEEGNALINFSMKSNHIVKTEKKIRYRHTWSVKCIRTIHSYIRKTYAYTMNLSLTLLSAFFINFLKIHNEYITTKLT